jgi:hypothetical protein
MSGRLYKSIDIWRRKGGAVVRYRCFHILPDNLYCVQSADSYRPPFGDVSIMQHDKQFLELLVEEAPELRSAGFPSLTEAIAAFDREFDNPA